MARVTPSDVLSGGFEADLTDAEVSDVIDDAHLFVSDDLADSGYSADRKDAIEKYLARHLIRFEPDRQFEEGRDESTRIKYSGAFDEEGLKATAPGQTVLQYDTDGYLDLGTAPQADFEVF